MMKIGITGGIGGGKSTFSDLIRQRGFLVYDTDKAARILQNSDQNLIASIIAEFGENAYIDNELNRSFIAEIVFKDPDKLKILNEIVHPVVKQDLIRWYEINHKHSVLFVECAILFEGGFHNLTDKNILITAPEDIRINRVQLRDNLSREQVKLRMKNQVSDEIKKSKVDFVLNTEFGITPNMIDEVLHSLIKNDF